MLLITTTKEVNKQFINYTKIIYSQVGRKLSRNDEVKLQNRVKAITKEMNLFKIIKKNLKRKKGIK